jgi:hypothetical protein
MLASIAVFAVSVLASSDHAAALSCVDPASTTYVLVLESIEAIDGTGDTVAERARVGESAELVGHTYTSVRDAGSPTVSVRFSSAAGTVWIEREAP